MFKKILFFFYYANHEVLPLPIVIHEDTITKTFRFVSFHKPFHITPRFVSIHATKRCILVHSSFRIIPRNVSYYSTVRFHTVHETFRITPQFVSIHATDTHLKQYTLYLVSAPIQKQFALTAALYKTYSYNEQFSFFRLCDILRL